MAEKDLLLGALRVFSFFDGATDIKFSYNFKCPEYDELINKYNLLNVIGNGSTLEKVIRLMEWCSQNVLHNGGTKDVEFLEKNSLSILDYSFQKGSEFGVYCRLQAIVFTECCLALGIKSRILHCLPFTPYDFETHVVSMVYIEEMNKWIMIDAGNGRYFLDEKNIILSPLEVRKKLGNKQFITCNVPDERYLLYMAKNLFYFKSLQINTFGADLVIGQESIYCVPTGFDVMEREIGYCQYAISNLDPQFVSDWEKALNEYMNRTEIKIASESCFFDYK